MRFSGWNRYPFIEAEYKCPNNEKEISESILDTDGAIFYGNGRSYGDCCLCENIINLKDYKEIIAFDEKKGIIHCQSGLIIEDLLLKIVPTGWFLNVTPGTKLITIGGAIAADVHGKNHHIAGCFSQDVIEFNLLLPDGSIVLCRDGDELFNATCGGLGLTGAILDVKFKLKKIPSSTIDQITYKAKNLKETFNLLDKYKSASYSVAWIDCLAQESELGRSLLMCGEFSNDDNYLDYKKNKKINIPFVLPNFILNSTTVKIFNWFYYNRIKKPVTVEKVSIDQFFYPLDSINNWNRIYGKNGFIQYQFILPKQVSYDGIERILKVITNTQKASFLAVLKLYGKANENYLSFPMEGYSLALDIKIEDGLFEFLEKIDLVVSEYGGRIYLAKDARTSKEMIIKGYPLLDKFKNVRKKYNMNSKIKSLLSKRIDL